MTYRLSSGQRYLNGELVDRPHLGPWVPADLFPFDHWLPNLEEDLEAAGLQDLDYCLDGEWEQIQSWLDSLIDSPIPLMFLIELCCGEDELLSKDMIETRLRDFPAHWRSACFAAIDEAPNWLGEEILLVVAWAVRIERARRIVEPRTEEAPRSTLTFFRPG